MSRILVIDDEKSIRATLREILEYEKYEVDEAQDGVEALKKLTSAKFDAILCDIKMPKMDGLEVMDKIMGMTDTPVVMISGHGTIDTAVEAIKQGAFDYIAKPIDLNRLLVTLRNALDKNYLLAETKTLRDRIEKRWEIVGNSTAIVKVKELIDKVAASDARILITGENGTGKELVARQIHARSARAKGPFVEVNCAAIPSELIESYLFGHEKGSFTSAIKQHRGDFEIASGGTLFLDEIGDMSLSAQAKVLRALQEKKIMRVGGEKDIVVDVRVIAATNKDLKLEIERKSFREDLFHRLSVIIIQVPPLRERLEDIPALVHHFLKEIAEEQGKPVPAISDKALREMQQFKWTGNIRELRNVVERLIILCDRQIDEQDISQYVNPII